MGDVFNMVSFGASSERKLWGFLAWSGMSILLFFTVVLYFASSRARWRRRDRTSQLLKSARGDAKDRTGQDKKKKDAGRLSNVHQPSQIGTAGGRRYLLAMQ